MDRILVIDDDAELTSLLAEYLEGEGFAVEVANAGDVGLRRALEASPDLVVLDVMMPGMNGFELLRRLRAESSVPRQRQCLTAIQSPTAPTTTPSLSGVSSVIRGRSYPIRPRLARMPTTVSARSQR